MEITQESAERRFHLTPAVLENLEDVGNREIYNALRSVPEDKREQ